MAEDLMPQQSLHPEPSALAQELLAGAGRSKRALADQENTGKRQHSTCRDLEETQNVYQATCLIWYQGLSK